MMGQAGLSRRARGAREPGRMTGGKLLEEQVDQETKRDALARMPCLSRVDPEALAQLEKRLLGRTWKGGSIIVRERSRFDGVLLVIEGRLKLGKNGSGGNRTIRVLGPGDCLCFAPGHLQLPWPVSVECLSDARVAQLGRRDLGGLVMADPGYTEGVLRCLVERVGDSVQDVVEVTRLPVPARLAMTLLDLARRMGAPVDGGIRLEGLSHEDLAECVGSAREVVSRVLSRWTQDGLIRTGRRTILLKDLARIEALGPSGRGDA